MNRLLFTLFTLVISSLSATPKHYVSICAIFRDEAPFLEEWIEYHRMIGVEHFYLYNHLSADHYYEVLRPYIQEGIVELKDWPIEPKDHMLSREVRELDLLAGVILGRELGSFVADLEHGHVPPLRKESGPQGPVDRFRE